MAQDTATIGSTAATPITTAIVAASGQWRGSSSLSQRGRAGPRRSNGADSSEPSAPVPARWPRRREASKRCRLAGWSAHKALRKSATVRGRFAGSVFSAQSMALRKASPYTSRPASTARLWALGSARRVSASGGFRPDTAQYSVAPSAYRSVQGPCSPGPYCSKGAYPGVTTTRPCVATPAVCPALPKSSSTKLPSLARTWMLSGLMSRCRKPALCMAARPSSKGSSNSTSAFSPSCLRCGHQSFSGLPFSTSSTM